MIKIVGHKGAAGYVTENTLNSFLKAIEIGCDRAELDVRLTKDNKVVVFHDKEISKLTDGIGIVEEMTLSQLKRVNYNKNGKIPTLQEVIDICKNKIDLQIELKAEGTPKLVNDLIIKNNIENQVVVTSFREYLLKEIKELNKNIIVGLLFWKEETLSKIWNLVDDIPLDFLAPSHEIVTKDIINKAHSLGKDVYVYGVNEKEFGDKLIDMGVDAIGTDFPKIFIK